MNNETILYQLNANETQRFIPIMTCLAFISVCGVFGNGTSLFVYSKGFKLSNSRSFFVFLSSVELFTCIVIAPLEITILTRQLIFKSVSFCKCYMFVVVWEVNASADILVVIGLDRWRKICHPFDWQLSHSVCRYLCLFTVCSGIVEALPSFWVFGLHTVRLRDVNVTGQECSISDLMRESLFPTFYYMFFWFITFVRVAVLVWFHYKILLVLKQQHERFGGKARSELLCNTGDDDMSCNTLDSIERQLICHAHDSEKNGATVSDNIREGMDTSTTKFHQRESYSGHALDVSKGNSTSKAETDIGSTADFREETKELARDKPDSTKRTISFSELPHEKTQANQDMTRLLLHSIDKCRNWSRSTNEGHINQKPKLNQPYDQKIQDDDRKSTTSKTQYIKRKRNVTVVILAITVSSIILYFPTLVLGTLRSVNKGLESSFSGTQRVLFELFRRSYFLKSVFYPIIYGVFDTRFRRAVKSIFYRKSSN